MKAPSLVAQVLFTQAPPEAKLTMEQAEYLAPLIRNVVVQATEASACIADHMAQVGYDKGEAEGARYAEATASQIRGRNDVS